MQFIKEQFWFSDREISSSWLREGLVDTSIDCYMEFLTTSYLYIISDDFNIFINKLSTMEFNELRILLEDLYELERKALKTGMDKYYLVKKMKMWVYGEISKRTRISTNQILLLGGR